MSEIKFTFCKGKCKDPINLKGRVLKEGKRDSRRFIRRKQALEYDE
jgi:hypothetical protein